MEQDQEDNDYGLERAQMDLELLQAAYPDEIQNVCMADNVAKCELHFSSTCFIELTFPQGYPNHKLEVSSQRALSCKEKVPLQAAMAAIHKEAVQQENEHSFSCCAAAIEAYNQHKNACQEKSHIDDAAQPIAGDPTHTKQQQDGFTAEWIKGEPLLDRKSVFVAHVCKVTSEEQVKQALFQLLDGNSKLQRATHNMYAWRVTEHQVKEIDKEHSTKFIEKHDNSDDGEDGAGSRLAHLLYMRKEQNVLVVVSRWFGGIHLGPKRFAHISNVAQQLLIQHHEKQQQHDDKS